MSSFLGRYSCLSLPHSNPPFFSLSLTTTPSLSLALYLSLSLSLSHEDNQNLVPHSTLTAYYHKLIMANTKGAHDSSRGVSAYEWLLLGLKVLTSLADTPTVTCLISTGCPGSRTAPPIPGSSGVSAKDLCTWAVYS